MTEFLRLDNLEKRFGEQPVTRGVSLSAAKGEIVALLGPSGSGKTSLVNLIPRFYEPTAGRIVLDDYNIDDLTLASLRAQIALVSQDVTLFNDSVAANIASRSVPASHTSAMCERMGIFNNEYKSGWVRGASA